MILKQLNAALILLGADRAVCDNAVSWVRLPTTTPSDGERRAQTLIFWDIDNCDPTSPLLVDFEVPEFLTTVIGDNMPEIFSRKGKYYYKPNGRNFYVEINKEDTVEQMVSMGHSRMSNSPDVLSPIHTYLSGLKDLNPNIDTIIPALAGRGCGIFRNNNNNVLVMKSHNVPRPAKGQCDKLLGFMDELFDGDAYHYVMSWLKHGYESFYNNGAPHAMNRPSQFLNIVGDSNTGKSVFSKIPTILFGGGVADASLLFKTENNSGFNGSESGAGLLMLDDAKMGTSHKARSQQGETMKGILVGAASNVHYKGRDPVTVSKKQQLLRLLNPDGDNINSLPLMDDESVAEKVIIVRASNRKNVERSSAWFDKFDRHMKVEIPAFCYHLLNDYKTPEHIQPESSQRRFPTRSHIDPDYQDDIVMDSVVTTVANMILHGDLRGNTTVTDALDKVVFDKVVFDGTVKEIQHWIESGIKDRNDKESFQRSVHKPSIMLGHLKTLKRDRALYKVSVSYSGEKKGWKLKPAKKNGTFYWRIELPEGSTLQSDDTDKDQLFTNTSRN